MAEINFVVTNNIEIVGILKDYKLEIKNNKTTGAEYISGDMTVISNIDGEDNTFDIGFYSRKLTQAGEVSKLFESYAEASKLLNQKVRVTGSIREDRYFNKTTGQMTSSQKLSGRFISAEKDATPDRATFDMGGFVRKGLVAKTNKDNEIYAYELEIGQSNYDGSMMNTYRLHVDPSKREIVNAIQKSYNVNNTITLGGELRFVTKTVTQTEESAFGEPKVKVYTNTIRNFFITHGDMPITGEGMYDAATILKLTQAYTSRDVEQTAAGATSAPAVANRPVTSRQSSLI